MGGVFEFRSFLLAIYFMVALLVFVQHGAIASERSAMVKQSQTGKPGGIGRSKSASPKVEVSETRIDRPVNSRNCPSNASVQPSQGFVMPVFSGSSCAAEDADSRLAEGTDAQSCDYFSYRLASPQEHFDMWLKLNLYPPLCHTVLCRRQCALNGYESCNALGVKRSILQEVVQGSGSCDSGGCNSGGSGDRSAEH